MQILKNNEKVLIWLFRANKKRGWLAIFLNISAPTAIKKINENDFSQEEINRLKDELTKTK